VLEQGNVILTRVEELSQQLDGNLSVFGAALDGIAVNIALGASNNSNDDSDSNSNSSDVKAVGEVLQYQRDLLKRGGILNQDSFESALGEAMGSMEAALRAEIHTSINGILNTQSNTSDPTQDEKLDALLDMVQDLKSQTDNLTREFQQFSRMSESQYELLSLLERNNNSMPLTVVILPGTEVSVRLPPTSSIIDKMKNSARRRKDQILELVLTKRRVVSICSVTLQQVGAAVV
jgi:hypothetical protein